MKTNVGHNEQMVRLGAGAVLLASGLWSHSLLRLAAGGMLLWTAARRYCPLNEALKINTAEGDLESFGPAAERETIGAARTSGGL